MKYVEKAKDIFNKAKNRAKVVYSTPKTGTYALVTDLSIVVTVGLLLSGNFVAGLVVATIGLASALKIRQMLKSN